MFGLLIVGFLVVGCGAVAVLVVWKILIDGAREDIDFPLTSCDVSMLEEIREDCLSNSLTANSSSGV